MTNENNELLFYHEWDEDGELSNYYVRPMVIDGKQWRAVEHYYQAQKSLDPIFQERVRACETCDEAKDLGNSEECVVRADWDTWKLMAMRRGLFYKFMQHEDLRQQLLDTGDKVLHENSAHDYYWGLGEDKTGLSMLGKELMALREELRYLKEKGL